MRTTAKALAAVLVLAATTPCWARSGLGSDRSGAGDVAPAGATDVLGYGATGDGVADDTSAFQHALDALRTAPHGSRTLDLPGGRTFLIKGHLTLQAGGDDPIVLRSAGMNAARLLVPGNYTGTLLTVSMHHSGGTGPGFSLAMDGLTFLHGGVDTGGTAVAITTEGGGAAIPSVSTNRIVFGGSGSFATGLLLAADNITTLSDTYCGLGFHGTCVKYDTPGQISVEHHIKDLYVNGRGATGLSIGHTGLTGPLQGFSIRGLSCTGTDHCLVATSAGNGPIDEITLEGSQLNAKYDDIYDDGADTLIVTGSYFLGGAEAIHAERMDRLVVTGNVFYLGPPSVGSTNNVMIHTRDLGGGPASGSIVSGNVFTNLYGPPILLDAGSNYVTVSGNTCLGQRCVVDRSGNTANNVGPNLDNGVFGFATQPRFGKGAAVCSDHAAACLSITADDVGNARIGTDLPSKAGVVEIGPNVALDGTVRLGGGAVPATATTACSRNATAHDERFFYICVDTNRWKRFPLSSW